MKFTLVLPGGGAITERTELKGKDGLRVYIETGHDICLLIYKHFRKNTGCKNFEQWAKDMNEADDESESSWTAADAFDNLCNTYVLNIAGKYVHLEAFFKEHYPQVIP